jgi:MurNAc alpha-1-phosphate uridylyltransferase
MRPLTDAVPKPLLPVGGKPLIVWHLQRLAAAGFKDVVVNHAHLGGQIETALGDGSAFGLSLRYSAEPEGALETAGGIANALPLLGNAPFLVINGDIYCDWDMRRALDFPSAEDLVHLVLVDNPAHHPAGDFHLHDGRVDTGGEPKLTFAGIGIYRPAFFSSLRRGEAAKLLPHLLAAMTAGTVSGERHRGRWTDVGTPQRLAELDAELRRG